MNVLIDDSGNAQICDFGLVRIYLEEGHSGMTTTSAHTGTERYLAYELMSAEEDAIPTTASDIYATGCIGLEARHCFCCSKNSLILLLQVLFLQKPYSNYESRLRWHISHEMDAGIPPAACPVALPSCYVPWWELISLCWNRIPGSRPRADELFVHLNGRQDLVDSTRPIVGDLSSPCNSGQMMADKSRLRDFANHMQENEESSHAVHCESVSDCSNIGVVGYPEPGSKQLDTFGDLDDEISLEQNAVERVPDSHPAKPSRLSNLGLAFRKHFERTGDLRNLERAVSSLDRAVELTPDGHPEKSSRLSDLGSALQKRFEHFGDPVYIERAVSSLDRAVELTPDGHPEQPSRLSDLGSALQKLFERFGNPVDIERAISSLDRAVDLTPVGHSEQSSRLSNLGSALQKRFEHFGDPVDIERAVSSLDRAVELTPDGHPEKPSRLSNLGSALQKSYEHGG
jgi:hypothetical protein